MFFRTHFILGVGTVSEEKDGFVHYIHVVIYTQALILFGVFELQFIELSSDIINYFGVDGIREAVLYVNVSKPDEVIIGDDSNNLYL